MRSPEYQLFLDVVDNKTKFDFDPNEETVATEEEVGWFKQYQIRRAIRHARKGHATSVENHLLESHGVSISKSSKACKKAI